MLGQAGNSAGSHRDGVAALKRLMLLKVPVLNTLSAITRMVRLLYNLMHVNVIRPCTFQQRAQLQNSVLPAVLDSGKARYTRQPSCLLADSSSAFASNPLAVSRSK